MNGIERLSKEFRIKKTFRVFASHQPHGTLTIGPNIVQRCRTLSNIVERYPPTNNCFLGPQNKQKLQTSFKNYGKNKDFGLNPCKNPSENPRGLWGFAFVLQPKTSRTLPTILEDYGDPRFAPAENLLNPFKIQTKCKMSASSHPNSFQNQC